ARLVWVYVPESQRVLRHVSAVGIAAYPEIIILVQAAQLVAGVSDLCVNAIEIIASFAEQGKSVKIRPTFSHSAGLQRADSHSTSDAPVAKAVRVFMQDYLGV